jgi:multiple sugar transport system permease protein
MTQDNKTKKVKKSGKIRVDFERTSGWTRFKLKYLSINFLGKMIWFIFRLVLLFGVSYVILFPFFSKISSSFMSPEDFVDVTVKLIPKHPTLNTYKQIIIENSYFKSLFNTVVLSISCALIQTFMCCMIGYGFAKYKFKGSGILFALVMFTMIVPHQTLKLSMFMKFRYFDFGLGEFGIFSSLGMKTIELTNTYWPLIILSLGGLAFKNGLYIFMMRQFFRNVPDELEESAYIDGCGVFKTFLTIILPLSIPMMITIFLFAFSWQWTDNFYTQTFFIGKTVYTMPKIVTIPSTLDVDYAGGPLFSAAIRNTAGLVVLAPLIIIYLFCQRYLIQGIERSGITG